MDELTVFSPHRDDAVFSVGLCLWRWAAASIKIRIINFFTVSSYAPRALAHSSTSATSSHLISEIRRREDVQALTFLDRRIEMKSLDLLDAPLRLNIGVDRVCSREAAQKGGVDTDSLTGALRSYFPRGLILAPLGLGDHVDHLGTREVAIRCAAPRKLGFYEDAPYVMWTSKALLDERIADTEKRTGLKLAPWIVRSGRAVEWKRRLVGKYQSQVTRENAKRFARFTLTYGGGERIWIPKRSLAWRTLISDVKGQ